jgi:hypothetical protein
MTLPLDEGSSLLLTLVAEMLMMATCHDHSESNTQGPGII